MNSNPKIEHAIQWTYAHVYAQDIAHDKEKTNYAMDQADKNYSGWNKHRNPDGSIDTSLEFTDEERKEYDVWYESEYPTIQEGWEGHLIETKIDGQLKELTFAQYLVRCAEKTIKEMGFNPCPRCGKPLGVRRKEIIYCK